MERINVAVNDNLNTYNITVQGAEDTGAGSGGGTGTNDYNDLINKPNFSQVATSGDYNDLLNKPTSTVVSYLNLTDKPSFSQVAFTGAYNSLSGLPTLFNGTWAALTGKPTFFSGNYADLTNAPAIPAAQVNSDWTAIAGAAKILNKPTFATVATSGLYSDLTGKPTYATVATSGLYSDLVGKPSLSTVATTNNYNDLINKPNIQGLLDADTALNTNKVDKVAGKQLSTEDYTTDEKTKLSGLSNYSLPVASTTVSGGVKVGTNLTIDVGGTLHVSPLVGDMRKAIYDTNSSGIVDNSKTLLGNGPSYYLNRANHTGTQLCATLSDFASKVNQKILLTSFTAFYDVDALSVPLANKDILVYDLTNQVWYNRNISFLVPTASTTVSGTIKVGTGLAIDGSGVLSATGGGGGAAQVNSDWNATSGYAQILNKPDLTLKVDKINGKGLSTEDYTTTEKTKLASLANYSLPIASATVLGGFKVGTGLAIDGAGVLSSSGGGGGGLTNFTDTKNVTAPNNVKPVDVITAIGAEANIDLAIIPKGTGSILAAIPDNTATGGNKRATSTVDLQTSRSANTAVAGGDYSSILSGQNNTITNNGYYAVIAGGQNNYISSYSGFIGSGYANRNEGGSYAVIVGGNACKVLTVSDYSFIGTGYQNQISNNSNNSNIVGGFLNLIDNYSQLASIVGGKNNKMDSAQYSFMGGGQDHIMVGSGFSFIGGGQANEARAYMSSILAGSTNKILSNANYSTILSGVNNTVNSQYGIASGVCAHTKGMIGAKVWGGSSSRTNVSDGKSQELKIKLQGRTTAVNTPRVLTSDNSGTGSASNQITLVNGDIKVINGTVIIAGITNTANFSRQIVDLMVTKNSGVINIINEGGSYEFGNGGEGIGGTYVLEFSVDNTNSAVAFKVSHTSGGEVEALAVLTCIELNVL